MRLRSQFNVLVGIAALVGGVSLLTLAWSAFEVERVATQQGRAVTVAREVTGLLVLTQDYLLHGEPRARQQWLARYRLLKLSNDQMRDPGDSPGEMDLQTDAIDVLPELFAELASLPGPAQGSPIEARRRDLLVDRLLTEAEGIAEHAYELERSLTLRRNVTEARLNRLSIVLTALLALMFGMSGRQLAKRVLGPMAQLRRAMDAVANGQLDVRAGSTGNDELAELSRGFDAMTAELEERDHHVRSSEATLRLVTDNLPAMIGYWDAGLRNRFANANYRRWLGMSDADIQGRQLEDLLSPEQFAEDKPFIDAALAGRRQDFARSAPGPDGLQRHSQTAYIPDDHTGAIEGFFVLVTDVTERTNSEQALAKALDEKSTLLKEVYHRVKNNLQVIQSLLSLQGRSVKDDSARVALREMSQRVRSMALVHEQLYRSSNLSEVRLEHYVRDLVRELAAGSEHKAGDVTISVEAPAMRVGMDIAIPLGLLLTELVNNSFKHGFPVGRRGRISVSFEPGDEGMRVEVADDGVGLPRDFDLATSSSMGLQLAAALAAQLGGTLRFRSGPGTTAWLVLANLGDAHHDR